jgi:hypothetical protein
MAKKKQPTPAEEEQVASFEARLQLLKRLEEIRGSSIICSLTSLRPNVAAAMAEDSVRVLFDHLGFLPSRPVEKLDVFLCSNGGSGISHLPLPVLRPGRASLLRDSPCL